MKEKQIKLSGIQQSAYWWTNQLMYKVKELAMTKYLEPEEVDFVEIFYNYTDKEWRELYLKLTDFIAEDIKNFVPDPHFIEGETFSQDTAKGHHEKINEELAIITGVKYFPNIRLSDSDSKDKVIYTTPYGSSILYKSSGVMNLPRLYEPRYILTGDTNELNLYNQLVATLVTLQQEDNNFHDTSILRTIFCKEYHKQNTPDESIVKTLELFNKCYTIANERDIVLGRHWDQLFFARPIEYDYAGLDESYFEQAKLYVDKILSQPDDIENKNQTSPTSNGDVSVR